MEIADLSSVELTDDSAGTAQITETPVETVKNRAILEALLFASGEPLTIAAVTKATGLAEHEIRSILAKLMTEYRDRNSGLIIVEIAEGYEILTDPELAAWIRKMKNISSTGKLSQPSLETLSIIAYKQPITKLEVDQLRGVNSDAAVKSLLDKRLIKIVGKKETPGRPYLYSTTKEFLQYFGLKNLGELPAVHDFFNAEVA